MIPQIDFKVMRQSWYQENPEETWHDRWKYGADISKYNIQIWKQNKEDGLVENLKFCLDNYIKSLILQKDMKSNEVRELLVQLKKDPPYDQLIELFHTEDPRFVTGYHDEDKDVYIEAWLAKYGCVEPYAQRREADNSVSTRDVL